MSIKIDMRPALGELNGQMTPETQKLGIRLNRMPRVGL